LVHRREVEDPVNPLFPLVQVVAPKQSSTRFYQTCSIEGFWCNQTGKGGRNAIRERIPNLIRRKLAGGNGTHRVEIVREDQIGLPGATGSVNLTGGSVGSCVYSALPAPVTPEANKTYYLMSWETAIGDWW